MKKLQLCLVLVCSLFIHHLNAQITLGAKGGYTHAWEDYGDVELPDNAQIDVSGYNVSVLAYYRINPYLQIGAEPGFIRKGAACIPGWQPIFEGDTKLFLNYVEMPIMISGHLPFRNNKCEFFARLGYGASYLVKATREEMNPFSGSSQRVDMELDDESSILNRWDHGLYSNLGFAYCIGKSQIFLETTYYNGFEDAEIFNTSRNRNLNFNLGYMISL